VTLTVTNLPGATMQTLIYSYLQNQDGSGQMRYDWQGSTDNLPYVSATMQAEWIASGAGRADLTAVLSAAQPTVVTTLGTDCWNGDAIATYTIRASGSVGGDPSSCLF